MADARRSYEEYMLRRDVYVREVLGLTLDEISALAALLIGPQGRPRGSVSAAGAAPRHHRSHQHGGGGYRADQPPAHPPARDRSAVGSVTAPRSRPLITQAR